VATQELGALGPRDGAPVEVVCPLLDSLRSVAGWFAVILLLLFRKPNRTAQALAILAPLLALYISFAFAERQLNACLLFHYHQYLCSSFGDLFRFFALSLAVVLCLADRLDMPWRWLRFLLVLLLLFLFGNLQIAANAWPMLNTRAWAVIFGIILLAFMVGHSALNAVLRRCARGGRFRWWYGGCALVFGVVPLLVLGAVELHLRRSVQLQSTYETYRVTVVLASAISLPWFVLFWFVLLAARSPFYARRLAQALGVRNLLPEEPGDKSVSMQ
jgi:hypothetical protein